MDCPATPHYPHEGEAVEEGYTRVPTLQLIIISPGQVYMLPVYRRNPSARLRANDIQPPPFYDAPFGRVLNRFRHVLRSAEGAFNDALEFIRIFATAFVQSLAASSPLTAPVHTLRLIRRMPRTLDWSGISRRHRIDTADTRISR